MAIFKKSIIIFLFFTFFNYCFSQDVIELNDSNFESLTQLSTGNTTGSWFIKFYAPWCSHCKAMSKTWAQLATELKGKINVAKIDVTLNSKTRKRFKIEGFPTLLYFKNGKMYDYKNHDRSLEAFKNFVLETYKNAKASEPPKPLNYMDILKDFLNETFQNIDRIYKYAFPSLAVLVSVSFLTGSIFSLILLKCCCMKSGASKVAKKKD
ncbi:thioredoxin-related protein, putative [Plasmodium reichenowi]|uniref:Thioredoxin-related protein, putative n=11 Tax=Plasmodium (Laverania) TaxID=418107 RepID=Q8IDH5_PLAF7|nr:thioredoxin-related protein, putative [Plasmodium falciparum 3D7]XP_012764892.1 thioredoxin-related protein, putative [Plasmodium reichenowi]ETW40669.1 protein disulfide-isomerase domain [Plasmodium falciparum NF135/5.C10]ETW47291.1 protein disulfide-isomerase domain [Plasmodium falciparum MaliPS096_E11]ETW59281.1 protein disulfide-isomerase domain [Plasmodium falciparum CAMP/Malaysia]EUR65210.1 protein disulfide-isomerase domain [Plasmodium falciparum 7G8]EUT80220.1 protein disulfide-isom|eukprot:XP_001350237.1 thioredoxin-related protein, putative [Plasmodium falciparum 3D7]